MASANPSKSKSAKSNSTASAPRQPRRRTGASSRSSQRRFGEIAIINPVDVTSPEDGRQKLFECGRGMLARGRKPRVDPMLDAEAADNILLVCTDHAAAFAERMITEHLVGGAKLIALDLDAEIGPTPAALIAKAKGKSAAADGALPDPIDDTILADAYNFAISRRKALGKIATGPNGVKIRAAYGITRPIQRKSPPSVIRGLRNLVAGRATLKGGALAGRCVTASDIKIARGYIKKLSAVRKEGAELRRQQRLSNQKLLILQTALEFFYDLYSSACHLVFEHDNVQKLDALRLVPRRQLSHPAEAVTHGQQAAANPQVNGTVVNIGGQANGAAQPGAAGQAAEA